MVTLDGTGSYDDNGNIIGYTWYQEEGPLVNLSSYEDDIVTFTAPDNFATLVFSLEVIDNEFNVSEPSFVTIMVMEPISIHDIQYTTDQGEYCYETALAGQTVSISGVVTHVSSNSSGVPNLFVQDPNTDELWSGITVFGDLPAETSLPDVGDSVDIVGMVNEYYSLTQIIDITELNITSSGEEITPISVNASDIGIGCSESGEMHESMLVTLSDVTFVSVDEFGNWIVSDGFGETMVDDYHFQGTFPNISVGDSFECVTGVVSYSYSEFKVYPRDINDFSCSECISESFYVVMNLKLTFLIVLNLSAIIQHCKYAMGCTC